MDLSATYLAWVDFSNTEMSEKAIVSRVHKNAGIVASVGSTFGVGGEKFMRFNLACPKSKLSAALERLQNEFS